MKKTTLSLAVSSLLVSGIAFAQGAAVEAIQAEITAHTPVKTIVAKMEATEHANLTSRVSGYLVQQNFSDGAMVEKGDVIFEIDQVPYQQALAIAKANKQIAEASLSQAKLAFDRVKELQGAGGAAQANLDDATAGLTMAQAGLAAAESALAKAKDDLAYTKVRAPYAGRLGKSRFSIGDMVAPAAGPMIDLAMLDPINVTFNVAHDDFIADNYSKPGAVEFSIQGSDTLGELAFIDNKISPVSGTISISASFSNEDAVYMPNQIVRLDVTPSNAAEGVWIPQSAVSQDLTVQFVYVVVDGTAERREIEVLEREGDNVFVTSGIEGGESVITNGLLRVRPGAPVVISES